MIELNGNSGLDLNVVRIHGETGYRGLWPAEPAPTYLNLRNFVTDSMGIIDGEDYFYTMSQERDVETHAGIAEIINANSGWIIGDLYNGGICVYKTSASTLGVTVVHSHITKDSDPTRDKWLISPLYSQQSIPFWQAEQYFIGYGMKLDGVTPEYCFYYPGINEGGVGKVVKATPVPVYRSFIGYDKVIVGKNMSYGGHYRLDEVIVDSSYMTVTPLFPDMRDTYTVPWVCAGYGGDYPGLYNSEFWEDTEIPSGWSGSGTWYGGEGNLVDEENPDSNIPTSSTRGGDATPDNHSEDCGLPPDTQFNTDALDSGFISLYLPNQSQINDLCDYLFTGITENISLAIKRILQNPMDFIISLGLIHYTPATGDSELIKFCGYDTGVSAPPVSKQFTHLEMGAIEVGLQFKNFMDYGMYSTFKVFLPYCGIFDLKADDVMQSTLKLDYYIDNITGNCVAHLTCTRNTRCIGDAVPHLNSVLYKFTGNCMTQIPVKSTDWTSFVNGAIQTVGGVVGGIAAGGAAGVVSAVGSVASNVLSMKPHVQTAGNIHTDYGFMDQHTPYLICERPITALPTDFIKYRGHTSNITTQLKFCKGFTKTKDDNMWTMKIHGTDDECKEIINLLNDGIYI